VGANAVDAASDAPASSAVPDPSDLVRVSVDVNRGVVTFEIRFAAAWDRPTTFHAMMASRFKVLRRSL
jgi:hypothetical protein